MFGKDESTYACLAFKKDAFTDIGETAPGTTNIDFSDALYASTQQIRGYRATKLTLGHDGARASERGRSSKKIQVPDSWLRGFLQAVGATLPFDHVQLSPMDLYNVLRHLRMNGDRKGKKRGLRFELVPHNNRGSSRSRGRRCSPQPATCSAARRRARSPWGRRRHDDEAPCSPSCNRSMCTCSAAVPSFWVFRCGDITLTRPDGIHLRELVEHGSLRRSTAQDAGRRTDEEVVAPRAHWKAERRNSPPQPA